jgi:hypothetical protein
VRLEIRLGNPPFDKLEETEEGKNEGIKILHSLWPLCREASLAQCIEDSPGTRPTLWWIHDCPKPGRPFVKPHNWLDPADYGRFDRERREADLKFLREHDLLSPKELAVLDDKKSFWSGGGRK